MATTGVLGVILWTRRTHDMAFILGGFSHLFAFKGAFQAEVGDDDDDDDDDDGRRRRRCVFEGLRVRVLTATM